MTVRIRPTAPLLRLAPAQFAVPAVVASLLFAYWWQHEFTLLRHIRSLWGPYFVAMLGWCAAAFVAWRFYRLTPARPLEHDVPRREILFSAAVIGVFLVALQILLGILAGFGHSPYAHTPRFLLINLLFAGAPLLAIELSRVVLLRKLSGWNVTLALLGTTLLLASLQFTSRQFQASGILAQASFWGASYIPVAALGLVTGFFVMYGGIRAGLLITAPLAVFTFYSPILPNAEWPMQGLVGVAGPAMGLWIAESLFAQSVTPEEQSAEKKHRIGLPSVAWVVTAVFGLTIFWFSFGFFGYLPGFVPSHSMEPMLGPGDLILTRDVDPDQVKVGDVVMYRMPGNQRVLHRVVDIRRSESGEREFIFKGDHNNVADPDAVHDTQIMGKYVGGVPWLGWAPLKFQQALGHLR